MSRTESTATGQSELGSGIRLPSVNAPRLNIGCGPIQPDGWTNIDGSNRAKLASKVPWLDRALVALRLLPPTEFDGQTVAIDVRKRLPFAENSIAAVYGGEILEHFTQAQAVKFLDECFRVMMPGGVLRIRVPDNFGFWRRYVTEFEEAFARPRGDWTTSHERFVKMFFNDICVSRPWLNSMGHYHKWMFDEITLIRIFEDAGFVETERCRKHDSRIPDIASVESREDLIVEGIKPKCAE